MKGRRVHDVNGRFNIHPDRSRAKEKSEGKCHVENNAKDVSGSESRERSYEKKRCKNERQTDLEGWR
jgi:hypothetical protein